MQSPKLTTCVVTMWLTLCSIECAGQQILSVRIDDSVARMTVSDGTSFASAKAIVDALHTQGISDVILNISENGTSVSESKRWVHVIVEEGYVDQTQNSIIVCVSPDTPFKFALALVDALTAVNDRPVKFISKKTFDSVLSQAVVELPIKSRQ